MLLVVSIHLYYIDVFQLEVVMLTQSGAIAYGVGHINQVGGLNAWRWLFILEGLPCILLAVAIFLFLPSYPEKAKWLTDEETNKARWKYG